MATMSDVLRKTMAEREADAPTVNELLARWADSPAPSPGAGGRRRVWGLVAAAAVAVAAGVVGVNALSGSQERSGPVTVAASSPFPAETAQDWATFADHLVVGEVVDEQPLSRSSEGDGRGSQLRNVTLRVDELLWSREEGPPLPDQVTWETLGWNYVDDERVKVNFSATPRLEVGSRYLVPLVLVPSDGEPSYWSPVSPAAVLAVTPAGLDDGNGAEPPNGETWVHREFLGRAPEDVARSLAATRPYPAAETLMDADVHRRVLAVERARSEG